MTWRMILVMFVWFSMFLGIINISLKKERVRTKLVIWISGGELIIVGIEK